MAAGSRQRILAALRGAGAPAAERPPSHGPASSATAAELEALMRERLAEAGGAWLDWGERPLEELPAAVAAGSSDDPEELVLLSAECGVAESGAVWHVPECPQQRLDALLAEHVVVVLDRADIVADLHAAYARIDIAAAPFAWFLAGPSKTADIEQSLVMGAHGPRRLTLALVDRKG